jgi:ABC-type Fe3+-hydroxamate transport system substrate-binding protein
VIILPTEKFSEMPDWIKNLGKALKEVGSADRLVARWTDEISHLKAKNKNTSLRMYLEIQHNPLVTIGGESFLNDAFSTLGYENIFKSLSQSYPKVSKEAVLKAKPQAIFILDLTGNSNDFSAPKKDWETYGFHPQIISGDLFARCGFQLLKGLRDL